MSKVYRSSSRQTDIVAEDSPFNAMIGARILSSSDVCRLANGLLVLESVISLVAQFIDTHQNMTPAITGESHTTGTNVTDGSNTTVDTTTTSNKDKTLYYYLDYAEGSTVDFGLFRILDSEVVELYVRDLPSETSVADTLAARRPVRFMYGTSEIATLDLSRYELMAFLRNLPAEVYRASGSILEELAATYYKGSADTTMVTDYERMTFMRLRDKVGKTAVELASQAKVIGPYGALGGPGAYHGQLMARDQALNVVRLAAPVVYSWIFEESALGSAYIERAS